MVPVSIEKTIQLFKLRTIKKKLTRCFRVSDTTHHSKEQAAFHRQTRFTKLLGSNVIVMEFFFLLCVVRTTPISTNEKSMKSALPSDNILLRSHLMNFLFLKLFSSFLSLTQLKKNCNHNIYNTRFIFQFHLKNYIVLVH